MTGKSLKFKGSSKSANGIKCVVNQLSCGFLLTCCRKKSKSSADKVLAKAATGDVQQCEVDIDVPFEVDHVTSTSKQIKDTRTPAQRKFDDIRRIRQDREIEKTASMSHRERIEAMNTHLSKLSEHNDMPKIGPG